MRKVSSLLILLVGIIVLAGCSFGGGDKPIMDQASSDGDYHYRNKSLDFRVELPASFEYYQTQRKEGRGYTDIEFLVPTSDKDIGSKGVPGYARPMLIRVFESNTWKSVDKEGKFKKAGERNGQVYTVKFWEQVPSDWKEKWGKEAKKSILNSFQLKDI